MKITPVILEGIPRWWYSVDGATCWVRNRDPNDDDDDNNNSDDTDQDSDINEDDDDDDSKDDNNNNDVDDNDDNDDDSEDNNDNVDEAMPAEWCPVPGVDGEATPGFCIDE